MTKKDRAAIVFTILYLIPIALIAADGAAAIALIFFMPLFLYWSYRFIKGDISFIGGKSD